jgi:hypothetical protein
MLWYDILYRESKGNHCHIYEALDFRADLNLKLGPRFVGVGPLEPRPSSPQGQT